jgi:hypothetical protein
MVCIQRILQSPRDDLASQAGVLRGDTLSHDRRPMEFDNAVLNRNHLKVEYQALTKQARRKIWTSFLPVLRTSRGPCHIGDRDLQLLESLALNGRDVSAMMTIDYLPITWNLDQKSCICRSRAGNVRRSAGDVQVFGKGCEVA